MTEKNMHSQCDQNDGCTGKTGACVKNPGTSELQDKLIGALIGLARAADSGQKPTESTYRTLIEGLSVTLNNTSFDDDSIQRQIDKTHEEKSKLTPQCSGCASPCGRSDDYDMQKLWTDHEDIRSLKMLILFALCGMASSASKPLTPVFNDEEINHFFCEGLFTLGEELTDEQLLPTVIKAGKISLKCMALLNKANTITPQTPTTSM